ncbi:hypothetical protein GIB67_041443 [Kingdonia uniflora]|uniref:BTB domain-containing protein n=1 Tax=Kingdonia uniflora TaxID=39325 RepID=A0A7J7LRT1_9MAGN|nr:hypothetical protein GIB67_041443 [Kingdonia uniflora]
MQSCRGFKRFLKRSSLETSDYLKDDCLSVHCSVGVVKSQTEGPKIYSIAVPSSDIGQHFGQLLESGLGTDVNFEVNGEIVAAHKLVLATRSPVFRAQLFGPMKDRNTCIKVEDMEAPVFQVLATISALINSTAQSNGVPLTFQENQGYVSEVEILTHEVPITPIGRLDAVMQTDGFGYLKASCPSVMTELLEYVAKIGEQFNDAILDGSDINGRRVKQRI